MGEGTVIDDVTDVTMGEGTVFDDVTEDESAKVLKIEKTMV